MVIKIVGSIKNRTQGHWERTKLIKVFLQEWVCEHDHYVPLLYTYGVVGSVIGTVVFRFESRSSFKRNNNILALIIWHLTDQNPSESKVMFYQLA